MSRVRFLAFITAAPLPRERQTMRQIAINNGVKPATFYARIRSGWSPEKAAAAPTRPYFYEWEATR